MRQRGLDPHFHRLRQICECLFGSPPGSHTAGEFQYFAEISFDGLAGGQPVVRLADDPLNFVSETSFIIHVGPLRGVSYVNRKNGRAAKRYNQAFGASPKCEMAAAGAVGFPPMQVLATAQVLRSALNSAAPRAICDTPCGSRT